MPHPRLAHAALFATITCAGFAAPAEPTAPRVESFESGVPASYRATGGALSTVTGSPKDGLHALRWDFSAGDALEIKTGPIGPVNVSTGYGGYSRSMFEMPMRLSRTGPGKIVVELRAGDRVAGVIEVPLVHVGWQKLAYHYSWNSAIAWKQPALRAHIDNFRLVAADTPPGTHLLLDAVHYNVPRDFRDGRNAITADWAPRRHEFAGEPAPAAADLDRVARLARSLLPEPNTKAPRAHWERRLAAIRARLAEKNYAAGRPLTGSLGECLSTLNDIAGDFSACADPDLKKAIAGEFLAMHAWLQDQGLVVDGAIGKANNYVGRAYVDAVAQMRETMAEAGVLDSALAYIKWSYDYDRTLFDTDGGLESMDYFHNDAFRLLRIALLHSDPVARAHHVNRFRRVLGNQLVASIKPDGSTYHHGFHYFAYGGMGMSSISGVLVRLSESGLPVEERALNAAKRAVMAMRWYAGGDIVMLALCGRHPGGTQRLNASTFLNLARAYAPYRAGKPDAELAAAGLRLAPGEAKNAAFAGFAPEQAPEGFHAMPFAGFASARRDHWLAGVKGYGRDIAAGESYANANRFGLYLSNGFLELHTHPAPLPSVHGSGCRPDAGWNWCALDGATTIHAPLRTIANGNGTQTEYGSESLVGGLAHEGRQGAFALTLNSAMQAQRCRAPGVRGGPFLARKSWFFFDNRIVCLGSGITLDAVDHPVRTTLFQKFLDAGHDRVSTAAETITSGGVTPAARDLPPSSFLTDPYGNAYFTREAAHLTVGRQLSRSGYDNKDTAGDYATAWIDHGANPRDAGYEYAVFVQATSGDLDALRAGKPAYTTLRRDGAAHVVKDHATGITAYAVFETAADFTPLNTRLLAADRPCLVMIGEREDGLTLSLTDPAPRAKSTAPQRLLVRISGRFRAAAPLPASTTVESLETETRVSVPVLHGESVSLRLAPAPN